MLLLHIFSFQCYKDHKDICVSLKTLPLRNRYVFKVVKTIYITSSSYSTKRTQMYNLRSNPIMQVPTSNQCLSNKNCHSFTAPRFFNAGTKGIGEF